ncbi:hypothetical protein H310_12368 [Aphanomyces invadans]|uniref:TPX2 C-terminal domain-containing protein n=1 Tax=Aphanomyces invadans TaxID=157072 RepID=A0A024TI25_9STRA|nr:hypothetical protein H310_12368 [Aphanomyces invadans]ETV93805.1 hypothetical protein H310_12368 [Aphanomyces invadans]|eukprot:XP_008877614.1 hypothetical protein H310_12368 [Aphanomyces invadans]
MDMTEPEDEAANVFTFNAPTYYDLNDGEFEKRYVNNADGYFNQLDNAAALDAFMAAEGAMQATRSKTTAASTRRRPTPPSIHHDNNHDGEDDDMRSHTDSAPDSMDDDALSKDFSTRSSSALSTTSSRKPLTRPTAPTLHSSKRAEAIKQVRKQVHPQDTDSIELQKKFHARPLPVTLDIAPNIAPNSTKPLTQPTMPKLATLARMGDKKRASPPPKEQPNERCSTTPRSTGSRQTRSTATHRSDEQSKSKGRPGAATPPFSAPAALRGHSVHRSRSSPVVVVHSVDGADSTLATSTPRGTLATSPQKPLESERRAKARELFEARHKAALEARVAAAAAAAAAKVEAEERLMQEIRRQQTYRAKPYTRPTTSGFAVRPSTKELTTPRSPRFHSTKRAPRTQN